MKIGFIGVGTMGGPMCLNIIRKTNHAVTVFDLNADKMKACTDLGATAAQGLADAIAGSEVILTSLPRPSDVEKVAFGLDGILKNAASGSVFIDLSTNEPALLEAIDAKLSAKGITTLDAPVSGGVEGAENGTVTIMVGGDRAAFDAQLPLLQSFGSPVLHMGELGTGTKTKLINNMMLFCNMAATAEGMMLGEMAGIDPAKLRQVILNSSGNSWGYELMSKRVLAGYEPFSFPLDLAYKDLHLALELADRLGSPVLLAAQTHNLMRLARGMGLGANDFSQMMRVYESALGREVRAATPA